MKYEPLTPEKFKEKLEAGSYDSLTGARRAVGKASWADPQKDKARKLAEAHFGTETTAASKKPAAKKPGRKPAVKAAAEPKVKATRAPRAAKAAAVREEVVVRQELEHAPIQPTKALTAADIRKNPFHTIQLAEHAVQSGTSVLHALTEAKRLYPNMESGEASEQAIKTIQSALKLTSAVIDGLASGMAIPDAIKEAVSKPLNGTTVPELPGETAYTAPAASA